MKKSEQVISDLWDMFNKVIFLDSFKMKVILRDYNPSEIHCIEHIGKNIDSNVTKLAEAYYMTRSAISKLTKKLIKKGLIESYQKAENKKEIYFRLTEQGEAVYKVHENLHKEFTERDKIIFEQVTEEQFDIMLSFAEKYNKHLDMEMLKLNIDIKSEGFNKL
jgi:DNA-binding MarR family transcriptional regulator